MGSSSLWMLVFVVVYDLYTAKFDLHFIKLCKFNFLIMILVSNFRTKLFGFSSVIFKSYSPLSTSCQKYCVATKRGCSTVG